MNDARLTIIDGGAEKQLVLPMPLPYVPVPAGLASADLLALILVPLWIILSGLIRAIMRIEPPPQALFSVRPDRFRMELVAHDTGQRTTFECDPTKIVELRKNRYEKGLWLHVQGETMQTYMQDVDDDTVDAICEELHWLLNASGVSLNSNQP